MGVQRMGAGLNAFSSLLVLFLVVVWVSTLGILESQAKLVHHVFEVSYFSGSPDGVWKEKILGINGQFPGPTVVAEVGDDLEVFVVNQIQDGQNTSIHWHGIHHKHSHFEDGTSMMSQCPLPAGKIQVYRFKLTQAGTYWYHSHVESQYSEGLWGALIVKNSPEVYQYDEELLITLSDWYHRTAKENEDWHVSPISRGVPPYPDSGMINGFGRYPCDTAKLQGRLCNATLQNRPVFEVQRNKTYRIRVINSSAVAAFNFSIDGHTLETIEADGVDIAEPVPTDVAPIAAGQRYSFLIRTNGEEDRYLIRADLRKESLMLIDGVNINKYPEALIEEVTAVIEYRISNESNTDTSSSKITYKAEPFTHLDNVHTHPKPETLTYLNENDLRPYDRIPAPGTFDQEFILEVGFYEDHENIRRGSFNQSPFVLPTDKPLLMSVLDGSPIPNSTVPLELGYMNVIQVVINNPFYGPHPFHLHGHHFWVLGTGEWFDGNFDPARHKERLTLDGAKRDTVLVQEMSWAVIRFVADNPGVWPFHCHIDWHNLSGMAVTFIEAPDILRKRVRISSEAKRVCSMHDNSVNNTSTDNIYKEGDSPSRLKQIGNSGSQNAFSCNSPLWLVTQMILILSHLSLWCLK